MDNTNLKFEIIRIESERRPEGFKFITARCLNDGLVLDVNVSHDCTREHLRKVLIESHRMNTRGKIFQEISVGDII